MLTRSAAGLGRLSLLAVALTACATARTHHTVAGDPVAPPATYVQAVNRDFDDVDVRLSVNGAELPLGTLPGMASRTFVVPARYILGDESDYRLVAVRHGARVRLESPSFPMRLGQRVVWTIELQRYVPPMAKAG